MTGLPLDGVRVLDFCWVAAGPIAGRYLADMGAEVVKVESRTRPDSMRFSPPFPRGEVDPDASGPFNNWNAGKRSIAINMGHPKGIALARRIILEWADVVTENFTAGVMERWGLGYEDLAKEKPGLILLSLSTFGRGNALSSQPGYGPLLSALAGFYHLTGWPDRSPVIVGPTGAYPDYLLPRLALLAVASALDHRHRTGRGVHLDLAQFPAVLQFLMPALLSAGNGGVEPSRQGNRDPGWAPHGVFPTQGEDRWLALAVQTDEHWQGLRRAMGDPDWARDPDLASLPVRKAREDELEEHIARWTAGQDPWDLARRLQAEGVPAYPVQANRDLLEDPQLQARGAYVEVEHPLLGRHRIEAPEMRLDGQPYQPRRPGPRLGEHTRAFLVEDLGMDPAEVDALAKEGVLQ